MKTIEISLYKFDELSEASKQNAIENERNKYDINLDFFNDDAKEQIKNLGFKGNVKLQYSLSYSQGDGLSFSCDYFDKLNNLFVEVLGTEKQKTIDCIINNISFKNSGNTGRYCYASRNDISLELDNYYVKSSKNLDSVILQIETKLQNIYFDLCKDLENQGYKEIEYLQSDESISEIFEANEYDFTEEGKLY